MPANFNTLNQDIYNTNAILNFEIESLGTNPEIKLYYGTNQGLTEGIHQDYIIDDKWEFEQILDFNDITNNLLSVPINNLLQIQLITTDWRVKNDEGITWSMNTKRFTTSESLKINIDQTNFNIT